MRAGILAAVCVTLFLTVDAVKPPGALAMPAQGQLRSLGGVSNVLRVEDTCWWWGVRWQYGWRGYGWYPCWDWVKPLPTEVAPEAVPQEAFAPLCVQKWRDGEGKWHSRRVC